MSRCLSQTCQAFAFWIRRRSQESDGETTEMVYPQTRVRTPPAEGLSEEEVKLYEETAAVGPVSRRAACALLRVLLEVFLKRHLTEAGHPVNNKKFSRADRAGRSASWPVSNVEERADRRQQAREHSSTRPLRTYRRRPSRGPTLAVPSSRRPARQATEMGSDGRDVSHCGFCTCMAQCWVSCAS